MLCTSTSMFNCINLNLEKIKKNWINLSLMKICHVAYQIKFPSKNNSHNLRKF